MNTLGELKSKIEELLTESYAKGTFKYEMKNFKAKVLDNKKLSKAYHIYNELSENKGFTKDFAKEFINECIVEYNKLNLTESDFKPVIRWVDKVKIKNKYEEIDILLTNDILQLENKVLAKDLISSKLSLKKEIVESNVNLPISTMIDIANKTLSNYIENLNESEKKELMGVLTINEEELNTSFTSLKEDTISKLNNLYESEKDSEIKNRITETIQKINNEKADRINFFKMKKLNESIQ